MHTKTHIIIGSSAAGLSAAMTLSRQDAHARIICISDEQEQPYNKCFLVDYVSADRSRQELFTLRSSLTDNPNFTLLLGIAVIKIDPESQAVTLSDGQILSYDTLFMGMGGTALRPSLPGVSSYAGVFTFYTLADIDKLMAYATQRVVRTAVVIGAGLSGLECANAVCARGLKVTLVERGSRVLSHHTNEGGSSFIAQAAQAMGVTIVTMTEIKEITGDDGHVTGVLLSDGTCLSTDIVIFAVGMRPNTVLAQQAGIALHGRHVNVDNRLQTNKANIFAGGDLVVAPCVLTGLLVPSTTWPDAVLQGSIAAYGMMGQARVYPGVIGHTVSHFFGSAIASCGTLQGSSKRKTIVVESPDTYRVFELEEGVLKAYCLIGSAGNAAMACRRALLTKQPISPDELRSL